MPDQPTTPAETDLTALPGRAVDVVHAAILAIGKKPYCITYRFSDGVIDVQLLDRTPVDVGESLFARLGAVAEIGKPWSSSFTERRLTDMRGAVPSLGLTVKLMVDLSPGPAPATAGQVADFVSRVDGARAAQATEAQATEAQAATPQARAAQVRAAQGGARTQRPPRTGRTP